MLSFCIFHIVRAIAKDQVPDQSDRKDECTSGRCNRQSEFTLLHFTIFH